MGVSRLGQVAQVAEIVAAVAVVISLIYVGREVQQNTAAVRGAAMQAIATADAEVLLTVAADSSFSEILRVGYESPSRMTTADAFRFTLFMRQFWLSFQNIYQQSRLELVDPTVWESYVSVICGVWSQPGVREEWPGHREILDPSFVSVVEDCP